MRKSAMHKVVLYDEDITDTPVVTLQQLCDARVSVCYGCSHNFKLNSTTPNAPFDLVVVVKMRREFRQNGLMQFSAPSNTYFHVVHNNPFYTPFECIASRFLNFNVNHVKTHYDAISYFGYTQGCIKKYTCECSYATITIKSKYLILSAYIRMFCRSRIVIISTVWSDS